MALKLGEATTTQAIAAVVLALSPSIHHLPHSPLVPGARNHLHASKVVMILGAFGPKSLAFDRAAGARAPVSSTSAGISLVTEQGDATASSDRDDAPSTTSLAASLEKEKTASLRLKTNGFAAIIFGLRDREDE
ncbi:hypothetical protein NL676_031176 [Syzygium grande]|nr:hypothetical protein NL676_031176 [Syzygium grande]